MPTRPSDSLSSERAGSGRRPSRHADCTPPASTVPRYIAFLRGINVGGHRVKMDRLRTVFEDLGLVDVSTFIASGNVIFSTESGDVDALTRDIEEHLVRELGYEVSTFLRTPDQLGRMLTSAATPELDGAFEGLYVIFLREAASEGQKAALADLESDTDRFLFAGAEVFWHTRGKLSESPLFGKGIEGALGGEPSTMRNVNTLRRIAENIGTIS